MPSAASLACSPCTGQAPADLLTCLDENTGLSGGSQGLAQDPGKLAAQSFLLDESWVMTFACDEGEEVASSLITKPRDAPSTCPP